MMKKSTEEEKLELTLPLEPKPNEVNSVQNSCPLAFNLQVPAVKIISKVLSGMWIRGLRGCCHDVL